jgi:hypothetical protein
LTKLKLFQKPLDILSSGILLATDCRFMNCWRNHAQQALQPTGTLPPRSGAAAAELGR